MTRPSTRASTVLATAALATLLATLPVPSRSQPAADPQALSHGLFSDIHVLRPPRTARQFVLLVTADVDPTRHEQQMLHTLVDGGAIVATVPFAPFYRRLEAQDGKCTFAPGAFENLSRYLQAFEHLPGYLAPMLTGVDDTAAYAYAVLTQAPSGTFASALTFGFCPRLDLKTPPCATAGLQWNATGAGGFAIDLKPSGAALTAPWISVAGAAPRPACSPTAARAFVQGVPRAESIDAAAADPASITTALGRAYRKLAVPQVTLGAPPTQLADLPIVEVPVPAGGGTAAPANDRRLAVLLSGDGGWAGIDKSLGGALAAQGVPVVGFDSLRYFWSARTPDELGADLDRLIRYYAARWNRDEVILIGYSQGADVLPFALNRLPPGTRASVRLAALLGPGQKASFEFHVTNWIGPGGDLPIAPEAMQLSAANTLCIYGLDEHQSLCPELAPDHARVVALTGGHHFGGDYGALAARIIEAVPH